jgi:hypothetical protein
VALDHPVHFLDVTAPQQLGERLQAAVRSVLKAF